MIYHVYVQYISCFWHLGCSRHSPICPYIVFRPTGHIRPCIRWLPLLLQVLSPTSLALLAEANHVQRGLAHGPVAAGHEGGPQIWKNCGKIVGQGYNNWDNSGIIMGFTMIDWKLRSKHGKQSNHKPSQVEDMGVHKPWRTPTYSTFLFTGWV